MIARLSYVMCDVCGDTVEAADEAEARARACREGFVLAEDLGVSGARDLCRWCRHGTTEGRAAKAAEADNWQFATFTTVHLTQR